MSRDPPVVRTFDAAGLARGEVIEAEPDDEGVRALVGCGQNLPDQKIVIADPETRATCPPGQIGEIWVQRAQRGPGVLAAAGIHRTHLPCPLSDTGEGPFLRTGDLGSCKTANCSLPAG